MKQLLRIGVVLGVLAAGASAQQEEAIAKMKMHLEGSFMGQTVKGAPYSADEVTQSTQVLADGNRIHHENKVTVYRDSEGRVRRETPDQITIIDPVARTSYFLNPKTLTAQKAPVMMNGAINRHTGESVAVLGAVPAFGLRTESTVILTTRDGATSLSINGNPVDEKAMAEAMDKAKRDGASVGVAVSGGVGGPVSGTVGENVVFHEKMAADKMLYATEGAMAGPAGTMVTKFNARGKSEDLGKQTIEGVSADGTRITSTIEAGAIGNDRPIQIVTERWYSPELQTVLLTKTSDPRMGETSFQLTNVRRGESAAYLFQVPAGYTVAERK